MVDRPIPSARGDFREVNDPRYADFQGDPEIFSRIQAIAKETKDLQNQLDQAFKEEGLRRVERAKADILQERVSQQRRFGLTMHDRETRPDLSPKSIEDAAISRVAQCHRQDHEMLVTQQRAKVEALFDPPTVERPEVGAPASWQQEPPSQHLPQGAYKAQDPNNEPVAVILPSNSRISINARNNAALFVRDPDTGILAPDGRYSLDEAQKRGAHAYDRYMMDHYIDEPEKAAPYVERYLAHEEREMTFDHGGPSLDLADSGSDP